MMKFVKIAAAGALVLGTASASFAQSGPVDSKGQAGSVQQFGSSVTKGTNGTDAAASRDRLGVSDSQTGTSQLSVQGGRSTETTGSIDAPRGSSGGTTNPQAEVR